MPPSLDDFERLLASIRDSADADVLAQARQRLTEYAAIETGALEGLYEAGRGFTVTLAAQGAVITALEQQRGQPVARAVEDQLEAFNLTFDVATRREPITEVFIRQLHEINCRNQTTYVVHTDVGPQSRELVAGRYKTEPNNPYRLDGELAHAYAPVVDVPPEMERLMRELHSSAFDNAHPAIQAAYCHHAFTSIHPFPDGNGRVARSLASVFTYRRPGLPLVIFDDEKVEYIRSLEAADEGAYQPFVDFVSERMVEAIQLVNDFLQEAVTPTDEQAVARLRTTLNAGFGDLTHPEADALASLLLDLAQKEVTNWIAEHSLPDGVSVHSGLLHAAVSDSRPPDGYRPLVSNPRTVSLNVSIHPPAQANMQVRVGAVISLAAGQMFDFELVAIDANGSTYVPAFGARLSEIKPHPTNAMTMRLRNWIRRLAGKAISDATIQAEAALNAQGYRKWSLGVDGQ